MANTELLKMTRGGVGGRKRRLPAEGRVSLLTPEVSKKICDTIKGGNYLSVAAAYAGVSERTVQAWLTKGRDASNPRGYAMYRRFVQDVEEAQAAAEVAAVLHWRVAMPKDWRSAEKWLQRRAPERWADPKDGSGMQAGAYAGIQLNINTGGIGQNGTQTGQTGLEVPLEQLLEAQPHLIEGTMQFLDQVLPVEAVDGVIDHQYDAETPEKPLTTPKPALNTELRPQTAQTTPKTPSGPPPTPKDVITTLQVPRNPQNDANDAIFDAEPGSWREIDGNEGPNTPNDDKW